MWKTKNKDKETLIPRGEEMFTLPSRLWNRKIYVKAGIITGPSKRSLGNLDVVQEEQRMLAVILVKI